MTTANEYPKACTMEEAMVCVRDGGEAQASALYSGFTGFLFFDMDGVFRDSAASHEAKKEWQYQITKPAQAASAEPRTYSTAEAIVELYAGKVKKFTGKDSDGDRVSCSLSSSGNVYAINNAGYALNHIPNIRWLQVAEKPAAVEGTVVIPSRVHDVLRPNIDSDICEFRKNWPGDVRVTWKVEAV
jgi:hypothetical protein